jgi:glycosyltransferase involved in cell wall biosynthesis
VTPPRIAIVHDWLVTPGGGEQVLTEVLREFPGADVFSTVDRMAAGDRDRIGLKKVHTSPLQYLPGVARYYRLLLPLMPWAMRQLDVSAYDLIISISHAVAKGVVTLPGQRHVCICLSPMRYAWDLREQYLGESGLSSGPRGWLARKVLDRMQRWDLVNSVRVTEFIAISNYVAGRIERAYGRMSTVIYPPVDTEYFTPDETGGGRGNHYVTASRFVQYKRIDLIVRAFAAMPDRTLTVIGDGPDWDKVQRAASPNVTLLGRQPREVLRAQLRRARAFVFAADEDFGIAPAEAQACGTPVIAYGKGGALETIRGLDSAQPTGLFFSEQSEAAIRDAIDSFEQRSALFSPAACRLNAERFSAARFRAALRAALDSSMAR